MKKSALKELSLKTREELIKTLNDVRSDLGKIMIQFKAGKMKDVSLVGKRRKEIAQILTVLRVKEK